MAWWLWLHAVVASYVLLSSLGDYSQAAEATPCQANHTFTKKSDVNALQNLFAAWKYSTRLSHWSMNESADPCGDKWEGVTCEPAPLNYPCNVSVLGLQLINLNLEGNDLSSIGGLTNLTVLDIAGNPNLTGNLPDSIGNLTNLMSLQLHDNNFSGSIPKSMQHLTSLQTLDLSKNNLGGNISDWIENLTRLQWLDLSNNLLNGPFPVWNSLAYVVHMSLSHNQLTGGLPEDLSKLPFLRHLNLSNNALESNLTKLNLSLGSLKELSILDLSSNHFSGYLPTINLQFLQALYMADNLLEGFDPGLFSLSNLQYVNFDRNHLNATLSLPELYSNTSQIQLISMVDNKISDVLYSNSHLNAIQLSASNVQVYNDLLLLGGNPFCNSTNQTSTLVSVCRFTNLPVHNQTVPVPVCDKRRLIIIYSIIVAFIVFMASLISFVMLWRLLQQANSLLHDVQQDKAKAEMQPRLYSYNDLKVATQDFHPNNILGQGGFGVVYKGTLLDNSNVAVKQLSKSEQALDNFLHEIMIITSVRHQNLVHLKGCCLEGDQRILVYDYMENKNLADALWDSPSKGGMVLNWPMRFNIILGVAHGLNYLHEEVQPSIVHRDIKAPNILLDKNMNPKIGDFGLALLFPIQDDHTPSSVDIAGTKGYLSPEYTSLGQVSDKVDVFSFGILILEIISGRKNIDLMLPGNQRYILEWAWKLHEDNLLLELVDEHLKVDQKSTNLDEIVRVINIGLLCVQYTASQRPSMLDVVAMLQGHKPVEDVLVKGSELSKVEMDSLFASVQSTSLTPVDEDSPLLMGLPTTSASGAFIELGKLKPR